MPHAVQTLGTEDTSRWCVNRESRGGSRASMRRGSCGELGEGARELPLQGAMGLAVWPHPGPAAALCGHASEPKGKEKKKLAALRAARARGRARARGSTCETRAGSAACGSGRGARVCGSRATRAASRTPRARAGAATGCGRAARGAGRPSMPYVSCTCLDV